MRKIVLLVWLMLPLLVGAYHFGPGQKQVQLDRAAALLDQARSSVKNEEWADAVDQFEKALEVLPADRDLERQRATLERAKAQMLCSQLPDAHRTLKQLVAEVEDDQIKADARQALAHSQYFMTWLMRLEGHSEEVWKPEIESSRQIYRLLAEQAEEEGDTDAAAQFRGDLEASIRLARMDLSDLQGLPLPSQ